MSAGVDPRKRRRRPLVLETKIAVPALRSPLVERPRLLKLLDGDVGRRLTVVTGSPGAGKTTVLCQWLHGRIGGPVAWVSLDDGDNDAARLWAHVEAALARSGLPELPPVPRRPASGSDRAIRTLLDRVQEGATDAVLVLDNVHLITDRRVAEGLGYFVKNQPVGCQTVIASRSDPPFSLSQLRAGGSLLEIRERDLRFSVDEITELVALAGVKLSDADLLLLEEKTEGWAGGLQLAMLSLGAGQDAHDFVNRFAGTASVVADFLIGEVLDGLRADEREFLLSTSILDVPAPRVCDGVLDRSDSAEILQRLQSDNLLIFAVDEERQAYRYHHLFRDLLRAELHWRDPEREQHLHMRAADWYEREGDIALAIDHALAAGHDDRAIALIAESEPHAHEPSVVRGWLAKIPDSAAGDSAPRMVALAGASMTAGLMEEAGAWLRAAEQHLPAHAGKSALASEVLVLVAEWHAWRGQPEVALNAAERARSTEPPSGSRRFHLLDRLVVRMNTFLERFEVARLAEETLASDGPDAEMVAGNLAARSRRAFGEGALNEAERLAGSALRRAAEAGIADLPVFLDARLTMAQLKWERNLLDDAKDDLEAIAQLARESRSMGTLFIAELDLARIDAARGALREAIERVNALVRMSVENELSKVFARQAVRVEAEVWMRLGDRRRPEALTADLPYQPQNRVVMARCQLAKGRTDGARMLVADDGDWTRRTRLARSLILARCAVDAEEAREHAEQALRFAMQEGFFRTILEQGEDTVTFLADLGLDCEQAAFVDGLVDACRAEPAAELGAQDLSEREAVVLQCLPTHLSNQEIAAQLYVSPNTLKTHLRNIYRKLGVSSRREAVARAAALGLLPEPYESSARGRSSARD